MTRFIFFNVTLLVIFIMSLRLLTSSNVLAVTKPPHYQKMAPLIPPLLAESEPLKLTSSNVFTIYLPVIIVPSLSPKKGLAATNPPACTDLETVRASWYFNWRPWPDSSCAPTDKAKFIPRISGSQDMQHLSIAVANAQASGWLIGFNEPNLTNQSNISPAQGAILWKQIEEAALPAGIKLVSPTPNPGNPGSYGNPHGHQWLWVMVQEYKARNGGRSPHFDALSWNVYGNSGTELIDFLKARRQEALQRGYNVPIWVLEYAGNCLGSVSNNQSVMLATTPWLETTSWIGRYAWFANRLTGSGPNQNGHQNCSLINPTSGNPTILGQIYRGY
jgi:hypothetical protein